MTPLITVTIQESSDPSGQKYIRAVAEFQSADRKAEGFALESIRYSDDAPYVYAVEETWSKMDMVLRDMLPAFRPSPSTSPTPAR